MQAQINIRFEELVQIARQLPAAQWIALKQAVEKDEPIDEGRNVFRSLLLNGPTFTEEQLTTLAETRKQIDEWRTI